jgi:hypothetical protein
VVGSTLGILDREYTQCGSVAWWSTLSFHCALVDDDDDNDNDDDDDDDDDE